MGVHWSIITLILFMANFHLEITMVQIPYQGSTKIHYGIYDTFIVSFSRYAQFKQLMNERPIDERSRIVARSFVDHNTVFYADEGGWASKWTIEGD
jgi:hypothetical protein